LKNFSLYGGLLSYKIHSLAVAKLSNLSYFNNCYAFFLGLNKNYNYLKLISKQKRKGLFFDKFLLKHLVILGNSKTNAYLQSSTLNKLYRTFIVSGKKLKTYCAVMSSFFKVYSVINLDVYREISKSYLYLKEFLFNKDLNKELNSVVSIMG
jgi:hypothetical protein